MTPEAALSAIRLALDVPRRVRPRLRHRSRRLPAVRAPGAGRPVVHAAADGRADREPAHGPRAIRHQLIAEGVITEVESPSARRACHRDAAGRPRASRADDRAQAPAQPRRASRAVGRTGDRVDTAFAADRLERLNRELLDVPDGFVVNPKLARQLERRLQALEDGGIDGARPRRSRLPRCSRTGSRSGLSGQDTERGTFAHRHLVMHDPQTGETFAPIQNLPGAEARSRSTTLRSPSTRRWVRVRVLRRRA